MSKPIPWKLKPTYVKIEIDDATSFDVPIYPSQLVDEAVLWAELKKDHAISSVDAAKRYVMFSLKLRGLIDESVSESDVSAQLTVGLTTKLFNLFFYGAQGKPEIVELEEESAKKKTPTGEIYSGSSSSTTQGSNYSAKKTLDVAQST